MRVSGSSTAYWLKERFRDEDFKVVVVESNDKSVSSYFSIVRLVCLNDERGPLVRIYRLSTSSTMLSTGPLSQQFSLPEHVEMSQFTVEFLRHADKHLRILGLLTFIFDAEFLIIEM